MPVCYQQQMSAFMFPEGSSFMELLYKGGALVVFISVVMKALAYIITTYWRINRLHNSKLRQQFQMSMEQQQHQQQQRHP
jgi:hypothetical protein